MTETDPTTADGKYKMLSGNGVGKNNRKSVIWHLILNKALTVKLFLILFTAVNLLLLFFMYCTPRPVFKKNLSAKQNSKKILRNEGVSSQIKEKIIENKKGNSRKAS